MRAGTVVPATGAPDAHATVDLLVALNEGRDRSPGDRLSTSPRLCHATTLNEGRDRSPGDSRIISGESVSGGQVAQ